MGAGHTHAQSDITGLVAALAAKADDAATTSALALKAPLASPAFTGNPTAPTPSPGDNDTSIATTGFVKAAIDVVLGGVSSAFDTLAELAAAIATKADAAATTAALSGKQAAATILSTFAGLTNASGFLKNNGAGVLSWTTPGSVTTISEKVFTASGNYTPNANANAYEILVFGVGGDGTPGGNNSGSNAGRGGSAAGGVVASATKAEIGNAVVAVTIGVAGNTNNDAGTPTSFGSFVTASSGRKNSNSNVTVAGGNGTSNLAEFTAYGVNASSGQSRGTNNHPIIPQIGDRIHNFGTQVTGLDPDWVGFSQGGMGGNAGSSNNNSNGVQNGGNGIVIVREYR